LTSPRQHNSLRARRSAARIIGGSFGVIIGYLAWQKLWTLFLDEVPASTVQVVVKADAFLAIAGIAGVGLVLAIGSVGAVAAQAVASRLGSRNPS